MQTEAPSTSRRPRWPFALVVMVLAASVWWISRTERMPPPRQERAVAVADADAVTAVVVAPVGSASAAPGTPPERVDASPSQSPRTQPQTGTVRVRVFRWPDQAVPGVLVHVPPASAVTDVFGNVVLDVEPGWHRVVVGELPDGVLGPMANWTREIEEADPDRYFARHVHVEVGRLHHESVRLFAAGAILGQVVDGDGQPLGHQDVQLIGAQAPLRYVLATTRTNAQGAFAFEDVRTGNYQIAVVPGDHCSPLPERLLLSEGERRHLGLLRMNAGASAVRGRVVDETGAALAGVLVTVWPQSDSARQSAQSQVAGGRSLHSSWGMLAERRTDARGEFVCRGLPAVPAVLVVHREWDVAESPLRLKQAIEPRLLELRRDAEVDAGVLVGQLARTFRLEVLLQIDEMAVRARHPRLLGAVAPSRVFVATEANFARGQQSWLELSAQASTAEGWRHRWSCPTPHEPVWVVVVRPGFEAKTQRIVPTENGAQTVRLQHP